MEVGATDVGQAGRGGDVAAGARQQVLDVADLESTLRLLERERFARSGRGGVGRGARSLPVTGTRLELGIDPFVGVRREAPLDEGAQTAVLARQAALGDGRYRRVGLDL